LNNLRSSTSYFLILVFPLLSWFLWNLFFYPIHLGATEEQVRKRFGVPERITDCTEWVERGFKKSQDQIVPGCVKEFWYYGTPLPAATSYSFDENGKLIDSYFWSSW
jgi:hypothetical protein